jgi:hypothetical protein
LLTFGIIRQSGNEAERLREQRIMKRTHEFGRGRIASLRTKLADLNEAKYNRGHNRNGAENLRDVGKRLKVHWPRIMQRPLASAQD